MSDNHNSKPPIPQADMPAPSSRNVEKMLKFMAGQRGSPTGSDVATMDDAQFMASLDALLETGNSSPPPSCEDGQPSPSSKGVRVKNRKAVPVSTATSCASSTTSSRQADKGSASRTTPGVPQMSGASSTFPHPQTVMFPSSTRETMGASTGPSPLTARLAYNVNMAAGAHPLLEPSPVPSTVSSLSMPPASSATTFSRHTNKRHQSPEDLAPVSEDESERKRRRLDRNMREQERSHRISEQIDQLRDVLSDAKVKSKSDKYSTLVSVVDYIKELQQRSAMLDEEHRKLLSTIEQTNELANSPFFSAKTTTGEASTAQVSTSSTSDTAATAALMEEEEDYGVFVKGLDYKSVFAQNCFALAVASIDGRFLDCNDEFVSLCGFSRDELLPSEAANSNSNTTLRPDAAPDAKAAAVMPTPRNLSLFNLLTREDMEEVFSAMSNMLKKPVVTTDGQLNVDRKTDYWTGVVKQSRHEHQKFPLLCHPQLTIVVTLVRSSRGRPKFFNCALTTAT